MFGELFDPTSEFDIEERLRPHWSQAGAIVFITIRTHDSIPTEVLRRWDREKNQWLEQRKLLKGRHWSDVITTLDPQIAIDFKKVFNRCRENFLDTCYGACVLERPELAKIVADSLLKFDGELYQIGDFVIMPNHVHLLAAFPTEISMKKQCESWTRFTGTRINRINQTKGRFWQQEPFDHLVRSLRQYEYLREYIADNPKKANLRSGQHFYYRRPDD